MIDGGNYWRNLFGEDGQAPAVSMFISTLCERAVVGAEFRAGVKARMIEEGVRVDIERLNGLQPIEVKKARQLGRGLRSVWLV